MSRYQTIRRPDGPITDELLIALLAELGETVPARKPRPYTRNPRPRPGRSR
ncbi:hypothetical protein RB614_13360 [Phytohabitans sp. ZYX-F-186]|uniref:Uncharacterized protein n=1 Tax=Phytohabitans maris TaxID=3071409 RepID=A0ABU0ZHT6_9ACTN|nr:hypothetical protein [Phytohabitans sp. ZYX-F-186]MDQ7905512.1 hypothetical protein [Phytohabitans sp. ZYX-F-186]